MERPPRHAPPLRYGLWSRKGSRALRLIPVLTAFLALLLPGCYRRSARTDELTHISEDPVAFDPPARYPDIAWMGSLDEARVLAADQHKPMILFVRAAWSQPSVTMETTIWRDSRVLAEAPRFIALRVDLTSTYGAPIPDSLKQYYDVKEVPTTLIISSEGKILGRFAPGNARPANVAAAMRDAK
jgi:Thioredoxin-like